MPQATSCGAACVVFGLLATRRPNMGAFDDDHGNIVFDLNDFDQARTRF
jgi:uncharacterized protein (DUF2252 family)